MSVIMLSVILCVTIPNAVMQSVVMVIVNKLSVMQ
jgi:hypothetical protein